MKILIQKEMFAILPVGPIKSLDFMLTSSSKEEAENIKNSEEDMSDDKFAVIPATISISLETIGGIPHVLKNKELKKPEKNPIKKKILEDIEKMDFPQDRIVEEGFLDMENIHNF